MKKYINWILKYIIIFIIALAINFLLDRWWNEFGISPILELIQTSFILTILLMVYELGGILFNKFKRKKKNNI